MKQLILSFILIINLNAYSNEEEKNSKYLLENITLSIGNWTDFTGSVQSDSTGELNSFWDFDFLPYFGVAADYPIKDKWSLIPELGYVFYNDLDISYISKNHFLIRTDLSYRFYDWLRLRAGSSLMILTYSGQGGEQVVNGPLGRDTFYNPSDKRVALNQTIDFSIEYIYDRMSLKFSSYIYSILDEEDRMVSTSLTLNYLVPLKEL